MTKLNPSNKATHMGKDKMLRNGTLPSALHLDINLVHNTIEHVKNFHSTAPEHARVFELPSLDHLNANADLSGDSCSDNEWIWEEEVLVDV